MSMEQSFPLTLSSHETGQVGFYAENTRSDTHQAFATQNTETQTTVRQAKEMGSSHNLLD